ncbi:MAG: hypothetical protein J6I64_07585, partial [Lachnospiraceae bacterium]|nr:hypothetical protein [Lachnospiraceae bacterium]
PQTFRIGKLIPGDEAIAWVMSEFYEGVTPRQMHQALKSMGKCKSLLHVTGAHKEKLLDGVMKAADRGNGFRDLVMGLEPNVACEPINRELFRIYKEAILPTVLLIHEFYECLDTLDPMPQRMDRNFD